MPRTHLGGWQAAAEHGLHGLVFVALLLFQLLQDFTQNLRAFSFLQGTWGEEKERRGSQARPTHDRHQLQPSSSPGAAVSISPAFPGVYHGVNPHTFTPKPFLEASDAETLPMEPKSPTPHPKTLTGAPPDARQDADTRPPPRTPFPGEGTPPLRTPPLTPQRVPNPPGGLPAPVAPKPFVPCAGEAGDCLVSAGHEMPPRHGRSRRAAPAPPALPSQRLWLARSTWRTAV